MRKIFFSILVLSLFVFSSRSQTTTADFNFINTCFGDNTSLIDNSSITGGVIQAYNWDIDSNGSFTDASGFIIQWNFPKADTFVVGLQCISDIPDTSVIYKTIIIYPTPIADFDINYPIQCVSSNSYTFTNLTSLQYGTWTNNWDFDEGITSSTAVDSTLFYSVAGKKTITLITNSDHGCKDTAIKNAELITKSVADFIINDTLQCESTQYFLLTTNNALACDPIDSFAWDLNNDGTFNDSLNVGMLNVNFPAAGIYPIGLKIYTVSGTDSVYKNVYLRPSVNIGFTVNDTTQCLGGNSIDFTNTSTISFGTFTSFWKFGNGDTNSNASITNYQYTTDGTFPVTLVTTSSLGCEDSIVKNIHIFPTPSVGFTTNDTIQCLGSNYIFTNTSTIASPWNMSYSWQFGNGFGANGVKDTSQIYLTGGTFEVKLYATSDSACVDSFSQNVFVLLKSIADFTINDSTQCFNGHGFTFTDISTNCSPVDTILWDLNNDGLFDDANGSVVNHSFTTAGTYPIGLQYITTTDTSVIYKNAYVFDEPNVGFTVNDTTQDLTGNNFVYTNTSTIASGSMTYLWDLGNSVTATSQDTSFTYPANGKYIVKLFATSDNGCNDSFLQNIYVLSPLVVNFTYTTACLGDSTVFTDNSQSNQPITNYDWDLDNDGQFNDGSDSIIKHLFTAEGTYSVGLQVKTATTISTIYKSITVNPSPVVDYSFNSACKGSTTKFTDLSTIAGATITKRYWDFDNNGTIDDSSGANVNHLYGVASTYISKLTVLASNGCSSSLQQTVVVNENPTADFTYNNTCLGDSVAFSNTSQKGVNDTIINLLWSYGDGTDAIIKEDHKHYYTTDGSYNIRLIALTNHGCKDTIIHTLTVYQKPNLSLNYTNDTTIFEGQALNLQVIGGSFPTILWSTNETTSSIYAKNTGYYSVVVTDANNCSASDSILLTVLPKPEITPVDVFTPNGDGVNDRFIIKDIEAFGDITLTIFNRWGDVLFEALKYNNDWEGTTANSKDLPEGTYYYIIKYSDKVVKGTVNIIR